MDISDQTDELTDNPQSRSLRESPGPRLDVSDITATTSLKDTRHPPGSLRHMKNYFNGRHSPGGPSPTHGCPPKRHSGSGEQRERRGEKESQCVTLNSVKEMPAIIHIHFFTLVCFARYYFITSMPDSEMSVICKGGKHKEYTLLDGVSICIYFT